MSAVNASEAASKSASKKKKKSKKKANGKAESGGGVAEANGVKDDPAEDDDEEDETPESPTKQLRQEDTLHLPSSPVDTSPHEQRSKESLARNGASQSAEEPDEDEDAAAIHPSSSGLTSASTTSKSTSDTAARLDAMQQEREELREEVTQLRQSLQRLQEQHSEEISGVREDLSSTQQGKEHAETQYRNLLGKVNTIRSQLGERLKADAEELEQARGRIEELEQSSTAAKESSERLQSTVSELNDRLESQNTEIDSIRSRTNLSTTNWAKERDDMVRQEALVREEYEEARQAMQDWEILATEERARREASDERIQELEDQINNHREAYERIKSEADTQGNTVDGLQRALRDLQEERKRELRDLVEQSQSQLDALRAQVKGAEESTSKLQSELETTKSELSRALPFEKEVKEKNLLIGKLRHEAVILNDHLTKALRFLKRGKPEDNVDRQLVTNHFLHFLALDRSDPKKFQILQLIAALLGWTEAQKEQAGLLRAGGSISGSLRLPVSPFRRTPSTPSLGEFVPDSPGGASRESLAELWSDFLEREAETGSQSHGASRRGSVAQSVRSAGVSSPVEGPGRTRGLSPEVRRKESGVGGG